MGMQDAAIYLLLRKGCPVMSLKLDSKILLRGKPLNHFRVYLLVIYIVYPFKPSGVKATPYFLIKKNFLNVMDQCDIRRDVQII